MRVVILGGGGMLGHKLWQVFAPRFDTYVTARKSHEAYKRYNIFDPARWRAGVSVWQFDTVVQILEELNPDVVVNAIGIVKQLPEADDPIASLTINSLFPHRLAAICQEVGARLIHISTDCVFSGRKGMYTEDDEPDATDLYGRSKLLGEVQSDGCLTVRTSIIGRELQTTNGLVEWFLSSQGGRVRGYNRAIYSGFTTLAMSEIIANVIEHRPELSGLCHVSSEPINKYDLLCLLRDAYGLQVEIEPYPEVCIDRSLDSSRFRAAANFTPPTWSNMIKAMAEDSTPYDEWRTANGS
ncbi:SDR family oxidoreductase [Thermodesulfovibrionales bacterium]|nr:SDR family oxidoreductase [Thermodesulfovibrionales bacterium]